MVTLISRNQKYNPLLLPAAAGCCICSIIPKQPGTAQSNLIHSIVPGNDSTIKFYTEWVSYSFRCRCRRSAGTLLDVIYYLIVCFPFGIVATLASITFDVQALPPHRRPTADFIVLSSLVPVNCKTFNYRGKTTMRRWREFSYDWLGERWFPGIIGLWFQFSETLSGHR